MKTELVFLSYGKLTRQIKKLEPLYPEVKFIIIEVTLEDVLNVVLDYQKRQSDCVFIVSGANASIIKNSDRVKKPFVEIRSTGYDLLKVINEAINYSDIAAIISFQKYFPYLNSVKNVFRIKLEEYVYYEIDELETIFEELASRGIQDIIGSSMVCDAATKRNMRNYLLWTEPAIRFAIDNAIQVAKARKEAMANSSRLNTILDSTHEGIIVTNQEGEIEIFNTMAGKITGVSPMNAIGKNISSIIENTEIKKIIETKKEELHQIQNIGDIKIVSNKAPIIIRDNAIGAVVTFQPIERIQKAEESIRRNLYTSGFIANCRFEDIIGKSTALQNAVKEAIFYSQSDSTILIKGESGTGKDLFAQSIHNRSARENRPFVAINCAALPANLLESELFGYEEGAFTGAKRGGKKGVFEIAHGGTIFLDEIAEMSLGVQSQLLRVLEQKEIMRIGGQSMIKVDVRVIAATNKDLWTMVKRGKFREDLYYRLNVLELRLPPLRERKEDISLLAAHFLREYRKDLEEKDIKKIASSPALYEYNWPGNIRELKNIIERFSVLDVSGIEHTDLLNKVIFQNNTNIENNDEKIQLKALLMQCKGNKTIVAQKIGISRTTLWRKLKKHGLA